MNWGTDVNQNGQSACASIPGGDLEDFRTYLVYIGTGNGNNDRFLAHWHNPFYSTNAEDVSAQWADNQWADVNFNMGGSYATKVNVPKRSDFYIGTVNVNSVGSIEGVVSILGGDGPFQAPQCATSYFRFEKLDALGIPRPVAGQNIKTVGTMDTVDPCTIVPYDWQPV